MTIFDQLASHYDSDKQLALAKIIRTKVQEQVGDFSGRVVIDYGCGTGLIGLPIAEQAKRVLFVDPSEEMIKETTKKIQASALTNAEAVVGTAETVQLSKEKADDIILSLVMLHVPNTKELLTALYESLPVGGRLLIVDFDKNPLVSHERVHNGFTHEEVTTLAEEIGFKDVTIETFYQGEQLFMNQKAALFLFEGHK